MSLQASAEAVDVLDRFRGLPCVQQPHWPDAEALDAVRAELQSRPPIATPAAIDALRARLADVATGRAFLVQGGDCAESFAEAHADRIRNKVRTILQMAVVLQHGAGVPVVKMGRMAGQYAKPRSSDVETRGGVTLPAYRGDMVNGHDFTLAERTPDPARLLRGYDLSAATLNVVRAYTQGGFASLRRVHEWNRGFTETPAYRRYESTAAEIDRAIRFMDSCGADVDALSQVDFYVGHEALLLDYERGLTRVDARTGAAYDTSGHFLWIGERTRQLEGGHVDFLSHVANPLGVKLGPSTTGADAVALAERLNPDNVPGRLTFITRMGAGRIRDALPAVVEAVRDSGAVVGWVTDPMHGNTITSSNGYKTRRFEDVLDEVRGFFAVHRALGTIPGGVHMELTGDDVTEVLGGSEEIDDAGLEERYETLVDPRLNHGQSLELAFLVTEMLVH